MTAEKRRSGRLKILASVLSVAVFAAAPPLGHAQTLPSTRPVSAVPPELAGRQVQEVRVVGKTKPLGSAVLSEISRQIRTSEGDKFDPAIVEADYQRVFGLKKFSNVEARVEPTDTGVIVIFEVTEQNQIREIRFKGNESVDTITLQNAVNLRVGEAVDSFRLALAREAIARVYREKNFTYAHVEVDQEELARSGTVVFNVVEGPRVRVRRVQILGNKSFTDGRIKDQIKTKSWFPLFSGGMFDPDRVEQDVAAIRQYYEDRGFFDVRVGRRVVVSPNQKEVMVSFLIEEGPRYVVDRITFKGNASLTEADLRQDLKLVEGGVYNADLVKRDIRQIVKNYSPLGFIYIPQDPNPDPDYMRIREERLFRREAGKVELVYNINEGKPFRLGPILIKGNSRTQDKVILREMRVQPGQLYNSAEVRNAQDRIRATGHYSAVTITPIAPPESSVERREGEPEMRALLVEVAEMQTARFNIGAGISSNIGVLGSISYEQRNFDISNWPSSPSELFSSKAFTGAGQTFRVQLEPGTVVNRARVDFIEPWIFDMPYTFGTSAYLWQRRRSEWDAYENRTGLRLSLGKRFSDVWSAKISLRGEDVEIDKIDDDALRAPEILEAEGHHTLTSVGLEVKRDTTDNPILPSRGTVTVAAWEHFGALGGDLEFDKFTLGWNWYTTVYEDLLDRRTIFSLRTDTSYIAGSAPFFERLYAGGIGSVRGFRYRGISPRSGIDEDPVGGDFTITGTAELNFPIAGDVLRGVVFADAGTVEEDFEFGTIRTSVGFGFRLLLPFFGQLPIALDFGFPITKDDQDDTRYFSFSLGYVQ